MGKRKSVSKGRRQSKSPKRSRSRSKSPKKSHDKSDVRKFLSEQGHELSPFITDNKSNAGLFMQTHALSSDLSKYIDRTKYNPFSPNANPSDYWKNMTVNQGNENNQFMQRLLDLNNDGQGLMLDLGGNASASKPLEFVDKHPNPYIPVEQSGGGEKLLDKIIKGGSFGSIFPFGSGTHTTSYMQSRILTPPKMPAHLKYRLKDIDQMIYTANIKDKETSKRLRKSQFQINSNDDGFDPDKEYLFTKKQF